MFTQNPSEMDYIQDFQNIFANFEQELESTTYRRISMVHKHYVKLKTTNEDKWIIRLNDISPNSLGRLHYSPNIYFHLPRFIYLDIFWFLLNIGFHTYSSLLLSSLLSIVFIFAIYSRKIIEQVIDKSFMTSLALKITLWVIRHDFSSYMETETLMNNCSEIILLHASDLYILT